MAHLDDKAKAIKNLLTSAIFGISALWQKEDANKVGQSWSLFRGAITKNAKLRLKTRHYAKMTETKIIE